MNPHDEQKLERLVHQTLRDLPARRAPRTLEARVFAEIERRAALPWWKQNFAHWPVAVRGACILLFAGVAKVALMVAMWMTAGFDAAKFREVFATPLTWLRVAANLASVVGEFCSTLFHSVPSVWLYGGAAAVATLYVAFFGLGTVAYRTLYTNR